MDNTSQLSQNGASSGGIIPLSLWVALLITGPADSLGYLRVASNSLAAIVSLLICYTTATFVLDKTSGHRWLNALALAYFGLRSIVHVWIAINWFNHVEHLPVWITSLSNSSEIIFGMYYYVTRRDLSVTYKRSEEARQFNIRRLDNISQIAMNLEAISALQVEKSHKLSELIANVGRD